MIDRNQDSIENCRIFRKELDQKDAELAKIGDALQSLYDEHLSEEGQAVQSSLMNDRKRVEYARKVLRELLGILE